MTRYLTVVTCDPQDDAALTVALDAHRRRRPRDRRLYRFIPSEWRINAVPSRSYVLAAPEPWWRWARDWRP